MKIVSVRESETGKYMAWGSLYIYYKQILLNDVWTDQMTGYIYDLMIDKNIVCTDLGHKATLLLLKSLEAISYLYSCDQFIVANNSVCKDMAN